MQTGLTRGDVAQLGERSVRNAEVEGSNPFISTTLATIDSASPGFIPACEAKGGPSPE